MVDTAELARRVAQLERRVGALESDMQQANPGGEVVVEARAADYWTRELFGNRLHRLAAHLNKPEDRVRSLLGKWRQMCREDDELLCDVISSALIERKADVVAWITRQVTPVKDQQQEQMRGY